MIKKGTDSTAVVKEMEYYENGRITFEVKRKGFSREGKYLEFHPNGVQYIKGKYSRNLKSGKWQYFSEAGVLD